MSDRDELIAQFIEISGGEETVARFYLSSSNWSLEDALSNFLGSQSDNESPANNEAEVVPNLAPASGVASQQASDAKFGPAPAKEKAEKKAYNRPKFATLHDMPQDSSNEEDEGQAFYAGGSERSGQQVLGPPKRKNFREQLTDMFRNVREQGSHDDVPGTSTSTRANWGQGVRLGMTDTDHSVVTPGAEARNPGPERPIVILKLWSQGFSIDDGELRLYDDPDNKEFLETVMRGEIPQELLDMGWTVNVDVEDHRHEDYKHKPQKKTFKGSGHTLGCPTPNIAVDLPKAADTSAGDPKNAEQAAKESLNVNEAEPVTTLQIRLADGSRLAAQFNLTHTVADIHQYIHNARPQYATRNFILVSSFPTRELSDTTATIESAGLQNAALMQRLA